MADVTMPQLGETVAEGTVTKWFKKIGDSVTKGESLFEVSTDKVDTEIPAPSDGILTSILVQEGETVDVGTKLATIGTGADEVASSAAAAGSPAPIAANPSTNDVTSTRDHDERRLSPVVRRLLDEHGLDEDEVAATGPGARLTRDDVLKHIANAASTSTVAAGAGSLSPVVRRLLDERGLRAEEVAGSGPYGRVTRRDVEVHEVPSAAARFAGDELRPAAASSDADVNPSTAFAGDEVIPFSKSRRLTAEHMVRSKATSAHTLMVREVDFEKVEVVRRREGAGFKDREGFTLTYLPFITVALTRTIREFPLINASVGNNELIVHHDINVGIAVDLEGSGLVVPVIHRADSLSLMGIARRIRELAIGARTKKLKLDDMERGTISITNPGPYGTLMTGAIINQPQVAILATDGIKRRPVVVVSSSGEELIAIHSMGLLALTFDHRAIDGAYAAQFLARLDQELNRDDWSVLD
ncbi:MAG TPA: 2-oxo acid dehydrogenase subunit E2 [Acidimicrobiales bacterium]|nr:2-oxo acid dehydrogenase subunit E2 [Acidimicrobiales bacterium]